MEEAYIEQRMGIQLIYTVVGTPQQNGRVERKFAPLYGRIRSMIIDAGRKEHLGQKLWADAANMCVDLDNILVKKKEEKNAHQKLYKVNKDPSRLCDESKTIWRSGIGIKERQENQKQD